MYTWRELVTLYRLTLSIVLLTSLLVATSTANAFAQSPQPERMEFTGFGPDPAMSRIVGTAWTIYAEGTIDLNAGKRFEVFINTHHVPIWSLVYLNSPGGNPVGAMALGRVIRKYQLRTDIGRRGAKRKLYPGICFSACALAYLGGQFRYKQHGSRYGVHRFSISSSSPENTDVAQILSAAEVEYIRSMGVDPTLWTLSAAVSAQAIYEPPEAELLKLNVINNGHSRAKWTIESLGNNGLYLKGQQYTEFGIHKFIIGCSQGKLFLYIVFDPQGRQELAVHLKADSLIIDGKPHHIGNLLLRKEIKNGWLNAYYRLTKTTIALIKSAHTLGVTTQLTYQSPIFLGFDAMPFDDGLKKLQGLLETCRGH